MLSINAGVSPYNSAFYDSQMAGSQRSAQVVLPLILMRTPIAKVIDVGCGVGPWASACLRFGIADTLGIDGDYVDASKLMIPRDRFQAVNLSEVDKTTDLGHYDLAISLEVAEHLNVDRAEPFIDFLTSLADLVLFSAAIPQQGGTHHINEQWQSFWAKLFLDRNFICLDIIRPKVWSNPDVEYWYRQNTILYCSKASGLASLFKTPADRDMTNLGCLDIVHPELYRSKSALLHTSLLRLRELGG